MKLGHVRGSINTKIILGMIYYLLITPLGLVMRLLLGKDSMHRAFERNANTYHLVRPPHPHHLTVVR